MWEPPPRRVIEALESEARTTAASPHNSSAVDTAGRSGCAVHVNVTLRPGAESLVVKLQEQDPISGTWDDITGAETAAITAVGHYDFKVAPGLLAVANKKVNDWMLGSVRAVATQTGGTTMTYGVALEFMP